MLLSKSRKLFTVYNSVQVIVKNVKMSSENRNNPIAAICQMKSTSDKKHNLDQVTEIVKKAKESCAQVIFLPECCDFVGENRSQAIELSEPLDGCLMKSYCELAKTNQMWLFMGGLHETITENNEKKNKIHNSHVVINENGEIVTVYRKLHLFDVVTPDFKFKESEIVDEGLEIIPPILSPIGKIGLQICYDLRFAEPSLILRKQGAEILTYPSAFAYSTGIAHWETLLRARAIENQCFVIAPAQIGWHNKKRQSFGRAMIVDPWGNIIAECDNDKELDVAVAEIDLSTLEKVRDNMPCFEHRRNDVYCLTPLALPINNDMKCDQKFDQYKIDKRTIFYETNLSFAFTNIRCVVPGHVLVASKRVARRLKDLTPDEISDIFQTSVKIQKMLEALYNCTSSTINVQDGPDSGQTVSHVHFHIMPRKKGDFKHNDMIYAELNKHDHNPDNEERSLEERIEEAETYRQKLNESCCSR